MCRAASPRQALPCAGGGHFVVRLPPSAPAPDGRKLEYCSRPTEGPAKLTSPIPACASRSDRHRFSEFDAVGRSARTALLDGVAAVLNGEARGNGEDGRIGFCAGIDGEVNIGCAFARIFAGDGEVGLEIGRVPELSAARDGLIVADDAGRVGDGFAGAGYGDAFHGLIAEGLPGEEALAVVEGTGGLEREGQMGVIVRNFADAGGVDAGGAGLGDGIEHIRLVEGGFGVGAGGAEVVTLAVDTALAVAAEVGFEVGGEGDAGFRGAGEDGMASAGEGQIGVGKDFDAGDGGACAAVRAALNLGGGLSLRVGVQGNDADQGCEEKRSAVSHEGYLRGDGLILSRGGVGGEQKFDEDSPLWTAGRIRAYIVCAGWILQD